MLKKKKMKSHKFYSFLILLSFLIANDDDFKAKKIMEKVISQPNPITSISEVKLEIVRNRANKIKENLEHSLDMKSIMRKMNTLKSLWLNL